MCAERRLSSGVYCRGISSDKGDSLVPKKDVIPCRLVAPYVEEYLSKRDMGERYDKANRNPFYKDGWMTLDFADDSKTGLFYSALAVLSEESGVHPRKIYQIRHSEGNVAIGTADKLFCAMDMPGIWYEDPDLSEEYAKMAL